MTHRHQTFNADFRRSKVDDNFAVISFKNAANFEFSGRICHRFIGTDQGFCGF